MNRIVMFGLLVFSLAILNAQERAVLLLKNGDVLNQSVANNAVNKNIIISGSVLVDGHVNVDTTTDIKIERGGQLIINDNTGPNDAPPTRLTIYGSFEVGSYQVFTVNGNFQPEKAYIVFADQSVTEISPVWFGLQPRTYTSASPNNNKKAVIAAISSSSTVAGGIIRFPMGTYELEGEILVSKQNLLIEGSGPAFAISGFYDSIPGQRAATYPSTTLKFTAGRYGLGMQGINYNEALELRGIISSEYSMVKNIAIDGNNILQIGIEFGGAKFFEDVSVNNCITAGLRCVNNGVGFRVNRSSFFNNGTGFIIEGNYTTTYSVEKSYFRENNIGIEIKGGKGFVIRDSVIESNRAYGMLIDLPSGFSSDAFPTAGRFEGLHFENNGGDTNMGGLYQLIITSHAVDGSGPNQLFFKNCRFVAYAGSSTAKDQLLVYQYQAKAVIFDSCTFGSPYSGWTKLFDLNGSIQNTALQNCYFSRPGVLNLGNEASVYNYFFNSVIKPGNIIYINDYNW